MYKTVEVWEDIRLSIPDTPIGINFSGGVDSSLLLYLLMSNTSQKIYVFTHVADSKGRAAAITSGQVIEKLIQLTGNSNVDHHLSYHPDLNEDIFTSTAFAYLKSGTVSDVYTAITANPPKDIAESFCTDTVHSTEHSFRDPLITRPVFQPDYKWHTPFTNIDKQAIIQMYDKFGLLETIFPSTRSCEAENRIEYYQHCGQCWWCKERIWAFSRLV
jgi:7-cyano-7-deazaguanine synthase in queuosine biosynthesis